MSQPSNSRDGAGRPGIATPAAAEVEAERIKALALRDHLGIVDRELRSRAMVASALNPSLAALGHLPPRALPWA